MRVLALASYPSTAAATRFRLTQYAPFFEEVGCSVDFSPFLREEDFKPFYARHGASRRAMAIGLAVARRARLCLVPSAYDCVFVQREAALIGPPVSEFLLTRLRRRPFVFDFDDALWDLDLLRSRNPLATRILRSRRKVWWLIRNAALVIAGSSHLAEYARRLNANVEVIPSVVSRKTWTPLPDRLTGRLANPEVPVIGWVGSHSTAHQLELVASALQRLKAEGRRFTLRVVGAASDFSLPGVPFERVAWSLASDVTAFQNLDIGLGPMHEGPVYQGKCGFKQLQYMAVGVPCVTSLVGGVRDFVRHEENALVASTPEEWYVGLRRLLDDEQLRARLAESGRALVESSLCAEVQGPKLVRRVAEAVEAQRRAQGLPRGARPR